MKCSFIECYKDARVKGFCPGHYYQYKAGKILAPLNKRLSRIIFQKCSVDGCAKRVKAKDLCESHYRKNVQKHKDGYRLGNRRRLLMHKFGISIDEYNILLDLQNGVCAICGCECVSGRNLAVDHDHISGKIRGLLCTRCNTAVGLMDDDPSKMAKAIDYLNARKTMVVKSA